jgi:Ca-activated chloride channel family protein
MPVNLPEGWDYDKVFGEQAVPPAQRAALQKSSAQYAAFLAAPVAAEATAGIALPQTATNAPALIHSGLLALLLAAALAALWWFQRHWQATTWARRAR